MILLYFKGGLNSLIFELSAIRTQNVDKDTGACLCAADFTFGVDDKKVTIPIIYKSELTDKRGEFYVTILDLWQAYLPFYLTDGRYWTGNVYSDGPDRL